MHDCSTPFINSDWTRHFRPHRWVELTSKTESVKRPLCISHKDKHANDNICLCFHSFIFSFTCSQLCSTRWSFCLFVVFLFVFCIFIISRVCSEFVYSYISAHSGVVAALSCSNRWQRAHIGDVILSLSRSFANNVHNIRCTYMNTINDK